MVITVSGGKRNFSIYAFARNTSCTYRIDDSCWFDVENVLDQLLDGWHPSGATDELNTINITQHQS